MDRRVFIKSASLLSVGLLAGCGAGSGSVTDPGTAGIDVGAVPITALLRIDVALNNVPQACKDCGDTVLPAGTNVLSLRGFDANGTVVYGPTELPVPDNNLIEVFVPASLTTVELVGLDTHVPT